MKAWREKFHAMAMAVAFAEEGEWDMARSLVNQERSQEEDRRTGLQKRPDRRPRQQTYRA